VRFFTWKFVFLYSFAIRIPVALASIIQFMKTDDTTEDFLVN